MLRNVENSPNRKKQQQQKLDEYLSIKVRKLSPQFYDEKEMIPHHFHNHNNNRSTPEHIPIQCFLNQTRNNPSIVSSTVQSRQSVPLPEAKYFFTFNKKNKLNLTDYKHPFPLPESKKDHRKSLELAILKQMSTDRRYLSPLRKKEGSKTNNVLLNPSEAAEDLAKKQRRLKVANFLNIQAFKPTQRRDSALNYFRRGSILLDNNLSLPPDEFIKINGDARQELSSMDHNASTTTTVNGNSQSTQNTSPTQLITNFPLVISECNTPGRINFSPIKASSPKKSVVRNRPFVAPFERYFYRDLIWKIGYSLGLRPQVPAEAYDKQLKVYIGPGNNKMLVKSLMKRRSWWKIVDKYEDCQFAWTQIKIIDIFRQQKRSEVVVPRRKYPNPQKTPYKLNVEREIKEVQLQNPDVHERVFPQPDIQAWKIYFGAHFQGESKLNELMKYRNKHYPAKQGIVKFNPENLRIHNHLENNYVIGNKKALFYTMNKYYQVTQQDVAEYLPMTFHIESGLEDPVYFKFINMFYENAKKMRKQEKDPTIQKKIRNIWIVKPGEFTNRGNGITVCMTLDEIKNLIKTREKHANGNVKTYIVQSYLDRPFLYYRRKFDIRHYMMITSTGGFVRGYFFEEGYLRTTSFEYNTKSNSAGIHLTNDAIQKYLPEYGKYEKGNKLSYAEFQKYLDKEYGKKYNFYTMVYPVMKKIAADSIRASFLTIDKNRKEHNFEVFGMDFMIDENFHPWLIEINTNPCLQLSCPLLGRIIPSMIQNALRIGLDPLVPPPANIVLKGTSFNQNALELNRFELIFDQLIQGDQLRRLYEGSDYKPDKQIGEISEDDEVYEDDGKQLDDS